MAAGSAGAQLQLSRDGAAAGGVCVAAQPRWPRSAPRADSSPRLPAAQLTPSHRFRGGWADKRATQNAGVSAIVAKRATQVLGFAAGVIGRGQDFASATRDVVGEARASIKGSSTFGKALSLFRGTSS